MENKNYAFINPNGGSLVIKVSVDNGTQSNWNCALVQKEADGSWTVFERGRLDTELSGSQSHTWLKQPDTLDDVSMAYKVVACCPNPVVERSVFEIKLLQDDILIWKKKSDRKVPQCSENKIVKFKGIVTIKNRIDIKINQTELWDIL